MTCLVVLVIIAFRYKSRQMAKTRFAKLSTLVYWYTQKPIFYHNINNSIYWYVSHITSCMHGSRQAPMAVKK